MSSQLNRNGMQELIDGDLAWLEQQPRTLEREHTALIVKDFMKKYHDGPQYDVSQMRARIAELEAKNAKIKEVATELISYLKLEGSYYDDVIKSAQEALKDNGNEPKGGA